MRKNKLGDRDEGVRGELLRRQDNADELDRVLSIEKPTLDTSGKPEAKSMLSTGRGCPRCKNRLAIKELNPDSGILSVYCRYCRKEYYADDLESTTATADAIHRSIPDDMMHRWIRAREESEKRKENRK